MKWSEWEEHFAGLSNKELAIIARALDELNLDPVIFKEFEGLFELHVIVNIELKLREQDKEEASA